MESEATPIVVFTVTHYQTAADLRFQACLATLAQAAQHRLPIVVVDSSPAAQLRGAMAAAGARVSEQTANGRKGAALREALSLALKLPGVGPATLLCWQEPEKSDMVRLWPSVAAAVQARKGEVVIPAREKTLFRATYPIEQFHSESFANALVAAMARQAGLLAPGAADPPFDWHFGPLAFLQRHASLWLADQGELWDAQLMPVVRAARAGLRVVSVEVPFSAPPAMKEEEEGNLAFVEKRLMQINFLAPKFKQAFRLDEAGPAAP
eukprot:EG_transcript_16082